MANFEDLVFSYSKGQKGLGSGYSMLLPDDFVLEDSDERDFVAWLPSKKAPNDISDAIISIYPGEETDYPKNGIKLHNNRISEALAEFLFWNELPALKLFGMNNAVYISVVNQNCGGGGTYIVDDGMC